MVTPSSFARAFFIASIGTATASTTRLADTGWLNRVTGALTIDGNDRPLASGLTWRTISPSVNLASLPSVLT